MISPNILKILESNPQDPSYSVLIKSFDQSKTFCDKDQITIIMEQVNPNLFEVLENKENVIEVLKETLTSNDIDIPSSIDSEISINSIIEKKLIIESVLDVDKDNRMYISGLKGSVGEEISIPLTSRLVEGNIKNNKLDIITKDYPNYFNKSKFRVKNNTLIITIPKKVESLTIELTNTSVAPNTITTFTEADIQDNKISIAISKANEYSLSLRYQLRNDVTTKDIESIATPLQKDIELEFNNTYGELPAVIITIDEDNKVYSSYSLQFTQDENNNYIGVKISFKNFKRIKAYGDVNITIIGDKVD